MFMSSLLEPMVLTEVKSSSRGMNRVVKFINLEFWPLGNLYHSTAWGNSTTVFQYNFFKPFLLKQCLQTILNHENNHK